MLKIPLFKRVKRYIHYKFGKPDNFYLDTGKLYGHEADPCKSFDIDPFLLQFLYDNKKNIKLYIRNPPYVRKYDHVHQLDYSSKCSITKNISFGRIYFVDYKLFDNYILQIDIHDREIAMIFKLTFNHLCTDNI